MTTSQVMRQRLLALIGLCVFAVAGGLVMAPAAHADAKDNNLLGKFELTGILPQPRGAPELECTFDLNADGILKVTAQDKASGRKADITISNSSGRG